MYKTIKEPAQAEFVEKKSRFIGHISPAQTEEEALAFIQEKKSSYWDANHNVYAYILRDGQIKRFSDDGEPQGTAGIPVLDVLQKEGLTDIVAVVTRYFGGILLGGGGLVRAYSHSVKIAVDAAQVLHMQECRVVEMEFEYGLYGKILYMLPRFFIQVDHTDFGAVVKMRFTIVSRLLESFQKALDDLTNGSVYPYVVEEVFADIQTDEE